MRARRISRNMSSARVMIAIACRSPAGGYSLLVGMAAGALVTRDYTARCRPTGLRTLRRAAVQLPNVVAEWCECTSDSHSVAVTASTLLGISDFNFASDLSKKMRMAPGPGSGAIRYFLDLRIL